MGQKTSPISLRQNLRSPVFGIKFSETYLLRTIFINYFNKKGFLVNEIDTQRLENFLVINIEFIISRNSILYTRRFRRCLKTKNILKQKNNKKEKIFKNFLLLLSKIYSCNKIIFRAKRLDYSLNKNLYNKIKKESLKVGLSRFQKHKSIQDLLIIVALLINGINIKASLIGFVLAKHFSWLTKKQQKSFLVFLRNFFKTVYLIDNQEKKILNGIKLFVTGRISGKAQASTFNSLAGSIKIQTLSTNVDYALNTSFSKLGTFGWKIWISKK